MAVIDRVLRGAFAVLVGVFYLLGTLTGTLAAVLGVVAVVFMATAVGGWCPIYALAGVGAVKETPPT